MVPFQLHVRVGSARLLTDCDCRRDPHGRQVRSFGGLVWSAHADTSRHDPVMKVRCAAWLSGGRGYFARAQVDGVAGNS